MKDQTNQTPLHISCQKQSFEIAKMIVNSGNDLKLSQDGNGQTALHILAASPQKEAMELLSNILQKPYCTDSVLKTRSNRGRTALHEAVVLGNTKATSILASAKEGLLLDDQDEDGKTALHLAVEMGKDSSVLEIVDILLKQGANPLVTHKGKNILDIAKERQGENRDKLLAELRTAIKSILDNKVKASDAKTLQEWCKRKLLPSLDGDGIITSDISEEKNSDLDKIRKNEFDVMESGYLELLTGQNHHHAHLYCALAYLQSMHCDIQDVKKSIEEYLNERKSKDLHPLYILAEARIAKNESDSKSSSALLREFQKKAGEELSKKWLTEDELNSIELDHPINSDFSKSEFDDSNRNLKTSDPIQAEWNELKSKLSAEQQKPMEELLQLEGLAQVKRYALQMYIDTLADKKLKEKGHLESIGSKTMNYVFAGNPGTGKTTVGELFADLLSASGARAGHNFIKMKAQDALSMGARKFSEQLSSLIGNNKISGPPPDLRINASVEVEHNGKWYPATIIDVYAGVNSQPKTYLVKYPPPKGEEEILTKDRIRLINQNQKQDGEGGVLFLDEAYDLDPKNNKDGKLILGEIMSVAEEYRSKVTIILAGYQDDIENKLFSFNIGLASRFETIQFDDFSEDELHRIWNGLCKKYNWICDNNVSKVASRRVARGIGRKGFGNARAVRRLFEQAKTEAKRRFYADTSSNAKPTIIMEDVIGLKPSRDRNPELKSALEELDRMIGLKAVKEQVERLVSTADRNYENEIKAARIDELSLNRLFVGNPGTGKSTVAKIYGRILKSLRLLSNGDVVYKTASDFVGDAVGVSQTKTKSIIELAQGKVLVIDEAYNLDDKMYGKQALDTIVELVHNKPGEDIAVILVGYEAQIMKMIREQNPGLARRFNWENPIRFEDYTDSELGYILSSECRKQGLEVPIKVKKYAIGQISKLRALPNFGNAGLVTNRLAEAKTCMADRLIKNPNGF
ncbi:MAG: AAA family ATPase [Leptospiraceae bacterium]|nr:AAA family ATPase [Leptospiraceae bacterium]